MKKYPSKEDLQHALDYCHETGIFRWKINTRATRQGDVAGCVSRTENCRILIRFRGALYKAHILAWIYFYGMHPGASIDHIDGDASNNRISNLRICTNAQNMQNRKFARSDSSNGLIGVTLHKPSGLYRASIQKNGKRRSLGYFKTVIEAHDAYLKEKRIVHEFNTL